MTTTPRVWGGDSEASIDSVNQWMRAQPWYREFLAAQGQSPDSVKLSKTQSQQLLKLAQANGAVVDEGDIEVDPAGNFNPKGHKLRNTLIGLGIGGAAALTGGAALGAFGGAGGAGAGAGGLSGLAGSSYVVPSAALGAGGGIGGAAAMAPTVIGGLTTPGVGTVATTPGVTAAGSAGGGMGLWDSILGKTTADKIATGLNLAGNVLQSRQVSKATQAQVDAANRALDLQRDIYTQQRSDLAGFADVGRGAISDMGRMTGTTPISAPTHPQFQMPSATGQPPMLGPNGSPAPHDGNPNNAPVTGTAVSRGSLASLGGDFVNMTTPDGRPARVPANQVQAALAAGGKVA